jgi:hypothetical protein
MAGFRDGAAVPTSGLFGGHAWDRTNVPYHFEVSVWSISNQPLATKLALTIVGQGGATNGLFSWVLETRGAGCFNGLLQVSEAPTLCFGYRLP